MAITSAARLDKRNLILAKLGLDPATATPKAIAMAMKDMYKQLTKLTEYAHNAEREGQDVGLFTPVLLYPPTSENDRGVDHISMQDVKKLQTAYRKLLGDAMALSTMSRAGMNIRSVSHVPRAITDKAYQFIKANGLGDLIGTMKFQYGNRQYEIHIVSSALFKLIPHYINRRLGNTGVLKEVPNKDGVLEQRKVTLIKTDLQGSRGEKIGYEDYFAEELEKLHRKHKTLTLMNGGSVEIGPHEISLPMLQSLFASQMPKPDQVNSPVPEIAMLATYNKNEILPQKLIKKIKLSNKELYNILERGGQVKAERGSKREISFDEFRNKFYELRDGRNVNQLRKPSKELLNTMGEIVELHESGMETLIITMYNNWLALMRESREMADEARRRARAEAPDKGKKDAGQLSAFQQTLNYITEKYGGSYEDVMAELKNRAMRQY